MSKVIKIAVVGVGHIGGRHAELISTHNSLELVAIVDIDDSKKSVSQKYNVPFYASIDELLSAKIEVDAISICTPNGLHFEQGKKVLENDIDVIIEKPISLSVDNAQTLKSLSNQRNKKVFCVMQNRYSPPAIWLKDMVDSGNLGQINQVIMNCFWNRDERYYEPGSWRGTKKLDGGPLFTQFSHFMDMLLWVFGPTSGEVSATFNNFRKPKLTELEDTGLVNFKFDNGSNGMVNYSTALWDKNFESSILILAENGTVKVGGQYMDEVSFCHVKDYEMPALKASSPPNNYGKYNGSAANHHFFYENVTDVYLKGANIDTPIEEGINVVSFIEKIYESR